MHKLKKILKFQKLEKNNFKSVNQVTTNNDNFDLLGGE